MTDSTEPPTTDAGSTTAEAGTWLDRVLELDVGAVAHGGHCVARVANPPAPPRVVFVRHALPGERVRAVITEDRHGSFCRADAVTVLRASPDRVEPPCGWARPGGCGGCDFQHASPAAQRALKADVLAEQLRRLAGVDRRVTVEELPGKPLGWRSRVRLAVDPDGGAGLRGHRGHDVIPIADCPLAPDGLLDDALARHWKPGRDIEVVRDSDGSSVVEGPTVQRAGGREWRLEPGMFWQVHPALADTLCAVVADWALPPLGGLAWDLYGGVGVLASVLADAVGPAGSVTVVESDRRVVQAGRAALADLPQLRWRVGRVERVLAALGGQPDVVVADPPRRGLGRAVVEGLANAAPGRVLYVACDPAALARDVATFARHGYRLTELRAFDAFPMTHHLECVALLERAG